jgi:hypothetical protein
VNGSVRVAAVGDQEEASIWTAAVASTDRHVS